MVTYLRGLLQLKYCIGFNIGRFSEGILIVGYCEDREVYHDVFTRDGKNGI